MREKRTTEEQVRDYDEFPSAITNQANRSAAVLRTVLRTVLDLAGTTTGRTRRRSHDQNRANFQASIPLAALQSTVNLICWARPDPST